MIFELEPVLNKQYLLSKHSQETYIEHYLGIPIKKGLFKSPLRNDNNPTCSFYTNKSGDLIFKDFSGEFSGNFIDVVMHKYNCSYYKAIRIIAGDFGLIKTTTAPVKIKESKIKFDPPKSCIIQVTIKDFSKSELEWWDQFNINKSMLNFYNVYSCKNVFLNGDLFSSFTTSIPSYGFYYGKNANDEELWRIYYPSKKQYRFISNWKDNLLQGAKQLPKTGNVLVITKSLKDVMTLRSVGVYAVAPCSENSFLTDSQLEKLKKRFKYIYIFYDNDLPGISNMNKWRRKYNLPCIWIPRSSKAKDISDYCKLYGITKTHNLIQDTWTKLKKQLNLKENVQEATVEQKATSTN